MALSAESAKNFAALSDDERRAAETYLDMTSDTDSLEDFMEGFENRSGKPFSKEGITSLVSLGKALSDMLDRRYEEAISNEKAREAISNENARE